MLFISHFYSLSIKTSTFLEKIHLVESLQVFGKIIWLSDFMVSISRCEDLIVLHFYLPMLKLVSTIFYQICFFHQMIALQKISKMFFISSRKPFSFSRYSNFCIPSSPLFLPVSHCFRG